MADGREYGIMCLRWHLDNAGAASLPECADALYRLRRVLNNRRQDNVFPFKKCHFGGRHTGMLATRNRVTWHKLRNLRAQSCACRRNHILLGAAGISDNSFWL